MNAEPLPTKPLALEPLEVSTLGGDTTRKLDGGSAADAKGERDLRMTTPDEFLAAAAKEYEEGRVDRALWRRAAEQCADDPSLVVAAYLRGRATVLRLQQKRGDQSPGQAPKAESISVANARKTAWQPRLEAMLSKVAGDGSRGVRLKLMYAGAAAAGLVFTVAIALLIVSPQKSGPVRQPIVSAVVPSAPGSAPPAPAIAQPSVTSTGDGTSQGPAEPTIEARVQQLKSEGKWNVLVLYAAEWTRKEPNNAAAWNDLSVGYAKLHQYRDALDAATKAVQLSPGDALFLRNLGYVNLAVDRLPEARIAFDAALAVSSDEAETLCGAAVVAQKQGRPSDASAMAARAASVNGICPKLSDGESVAVVEGGTGTRKSVAPVKR